MRPFLAGFTDELVKLGAFLREFEPPEQDKYNSFQSSVMNRTNGSQAKTGLKETPKDSPLARRERPPIPFTTPNQLADFAR